MNQLSDARILLVDDDSAVREVTAAMLEDLGYAVIEADSGTAALDLLSTGPRIDLVMADFSMPGMNGAELARQVRERHGDLPVLFVTGYADQVMLDTVGPERIVLKPFRNEELARKLRTALGAASGPPEDRVVPLRR
jgi:CheY-like chemotaxis protein